MICCEICDLGYLTLGSIYYFNLTSKDSGKDSSYMVPSSCLIWRSSCKASLFTIWNLSQVVILKLERCGFLFLKAYSVFHNSVLLIFFFFLNLKILCFIRDAKLLPNFKWLSCKVSSVTLWNASEVTILELERCVFFFLHFEVHLVSNNSFFLYFQFGNF